MPKEPSNVKLYPVVLAGPATVKKIWILTVALSALGVLFSASVYPFRTSFSILCGSFISAGVFYISKEGIPNILSKQKNVWTWAIILKYPLIGLLVYFLFKFNVVEPFAFLAGLSVTYLSIMIKGFLLMFSYLSRKGTRDTA